LCRWVTNYLPTSKGEATGEQQTNIMIAQNRQEQEVKHRERTEYRYTNQSEKARQTTKEIKSVERHNEHTDKDSQVGSTN